MLPSALGLIVGLVVHTIWFLLCVRLVPEASAAAPSRSGSVSAASRAVATGSARPSAPNAFVDTDVMAVTDEAQDIRTFRFARPGGFEFVAGQFLPIRVSIAGRDHVRCYSLSSSPAARGYLEISVKRQGLVSTALHTLIRPGSVVAVKVPAGGFTYPADNARPLLLLAGGIGITPLISMMRHGVQAEPDRPMTLLYSAPSAAALAFRDEIKALVRGSARANAIFAVTRGEPSPDLYPGRIDDTLIGVAVPNVADAIAMICGPKPMVDGMRATLAALGVPDDRIRFETFEAAVAVAKGRANHAPGDGAAHEMRCARSGTAVQVEPGQTLLEAAEAGGVAIDSLCRSGVCGTCRTKVVNGQVECASTTLGDADRQNGYVLACVSHVHGDCVIEA
jgi:ferredoxin-NADP reductase